MPTFERGDMWSVFGKTDHFIITTNPIIRRDGACVMGRGIAKEFADQYPRGPFDLGKELRLYQGNGIIPEFGIFGVYDGQPVYFFMVKRHWKEEASPRIIALATERLRLLATHCPEDRFDLNFPGIGNGKLPREQVLSLIEDLPSNVHVWEKDS